MCCENKGPQKCLDITGEVQSLRIRIRLTNWVNGFRQRQIRKQAGFQNPQNLIRQNSAWKVASGKELTTWQIESTAAAAYIAGGTGKLNQVD